MAKVDKRNGKIWQKLARNVKTCQKWPKVAEGYQKLP